MKREPVDLSRWLREARQLLSDVTGPQTGALTVIVKDKAGARIAYQVDPQAATDPRLPALSPVEADIIGTIAAAPGGQLLANVIAAKLRRPCDGRFRLLLTNLTERVPPVLEASGHGYRLVARPPPVAATASSSRNGVAGRADLPERP